MSFSPNINVWTLGKGANGQWKLHHTTESLEDAVSWLLKLEAQGKQVALYELGMFLHDGMQVAGQVGFWWTANLYGYMEGEPQGRGCGWSDGYDTYVDYTFPEEPSSSMSDTKAVGPWAGRPAQSKRAVAWVAQDERAGTARASMTPARGGRSELWHYFLLPGRILMWIDYMFPSKGRVLATARQRGNPIVEVLNAIVAWFVIILFSSIFLIFVSAKIM